MNQRNKRLMIGFIVAVALAGGAWLHFSAVTTRFATIEQMRQQEEQLHLRAQDDTLPQQVATLRDELRRQQSALPDAGGIGELLQYLGADLNELNVSDRSLTTGTPTRTGAIEQIPLNLNFKGSFAAAFELLTRLDGYGRIVRVERFSVTRSPQSSAESLAINAQLVTFARVPQESLR